MMMRENHLFSVNINLIEVMLLSSLNHMVFKTRPVKASLLFTESDLFSAARSDKHHYSVAHA